MRRVLKVNPLGMLFLLVAVSILVIGNVNFPKRDMIYYDSGQVLSVSKERAGRMNIYFIKLDNGHLYYVPPNYKKMFSLDEFQERNLSDPISIRYIDVSYAGAFRAVDIRNSKQVFMNEKTALQDYRELRNSIWISSGFAFGCSLLSTIISIYDEIQYGNFSKKKRKKRGGGSRF